LRERLERGFPALLAPVPVWPEGKQYAIVLSHDVDCPFGPMSPRQVVQQWAESWRHGVGETFRNCARLARSLAQLPGSTLCPQRDPNFGFARWMEVERGLGTRSAFYVATEQNSDLQGHPHDVSYDVRSKVMRRALSRAVAAGWEIGLHASINARLSPERIAQQVQRLERALPGCRVRGCRHHYWALDSEYPERTLRDQAAAGLEYDTSLGLNDAAGYRRGMCWPFTPYDRHGREPLPLLEIPPTLMDGAIFGPPGTSERGRRQLQVHLSTTFAAGGAAVLDWHVEQANPRRLGGAGPALVEALMELAKDERVYWASPAQIADWWVRRRKRIAVGERS
jgi:peptidoglycan/xylan/chitin deacetylase (PgdA/CDA1 family)